MSTEPVPGPQDAAPVPADRIRAALTAGELVYDDGNTQVFDASGTTTYMENGRPTEGEWYLDENGHFCSFWPPSYRACYALSWVVEKERVVGLRFTGLDDQSSFVGRYRDATA